MSTDSREDIECLQGLPFQKMGGTLGGNPYILCVWRRERTLAVVSSLENQVDDHLPGLVQEGVPRCRGWTW